MRISLSLRKNDENDSVSADSDAESIADDSDVESTIEDVAEDDLASDVDTPASPYMTGVVKVYAENSEYSFYDMLFRDNKLVYVDLEDGNGFFNDICYGTFGENAPNPIEDIRLSSFTVERAIEFFEEKGFTVTVTQE